VREKTAIFPGTFDPVTLGHLDVLTRALHIFDRVTVAVAASDRHHKNTLFSVGERIAMLEEAIDPRLASSVEITQLEGLLVEFARGRGVHAVVRGVRFFSDFEYELQMATMNQKLWPDLDTVFLMPNDRYAHVNSTIVKEIARHGGSLKGLTTPQVARKLRSRLESVVAEPLVAGKGRRER
jgi:pantetheine-phosphate adenylyltransferase